MTDLREDLHLLIVAREFPTASGPIDAVGIDDEGHLYLIETKLYRNPDKRRVLAQVMDYGASLWRRHGDPSSFRERLEDAARRLTGADLVEKLCEAFVIEPADAEALLAGVETAVTEGRFRFVVLMDHLGDTLKDLIAFINENSRFDVFGVELEFYRFDGYEVTLPKLYGSEVRKEVATGGSRRRWDERSFFEDAEEKLPPEHLASLRRLYDFARSHADQISWGTGVKTGSFNPKYDRVSPKSLYSVYSDGGLILHFDWLCDEEGWLPEPVRRLAERLGELRGFELPADFERRHVQALAAVWAAEVEGFIEAVWDVLPLPEGD